MDAERDDDDSQLQFNSSSVTALRSRLSAYALSSSSRTYSPRKATGNPTSSRAVSESPKKRAASSKDDVDRSPPPKKAKRGYAPPETYAHLSAPPEHLENDLDVVFCGINPGYTSAETGHHFAHPTNRFWKCLSEAKLTPRLYSPTEDSTLPATCRIGITNLVTRPTAEAAELSAAEMRSSAPALLAKLARYRPRLVVFVGKVNWTAVQHALRPLSAGALDKTKSVFGLQPVKLAYPAEAERPSETLLYVVPSTSGLCRVKNVEMIALFAGAKTIAEQLSQGDMDSSNMTAVTVPAQEHG